MKKRMDGDRLEEKKNHYHGQTRLDLGKTDVLSVKIELDSEKHRQIALMYSGGWEVYRQKETWGSRRTAGWTQASNMPV